MTDSQKDNGVKDNGVKDMEQYVFLKAQKLASALYIITGFLNDLDPLKWNLRDRALYLLSHMNPGGFTEAVSLIDQLLTLIDVGLISGAVSEMNFSLLRKEYNSLRDLLVGDDRVRRLTVLPAAPYLPQAKTAASLVSSQAERLLNRGQNKAETGRRVDPERGAKILGFLKKQGPSSIRDIGRAVPHLGAKTVQRELVRLVQAGVLKKEGEKRWSQYSVVS